MEHRGHVQAIKENVSLDFRQHIYATIDIHEFGKLCSPS
jgi:hypothetical protein